jgi:hypothetical protein
MEAQDAVPVLISHLKPGIAQKPIIEALGMVGDMHVIPYLIRSAEASPGTTHEVARSGRMQRKLLSINLN